jgi:hypothetical protein
MLSEILGRNVLSGADVIATSERNRKLNGRIVIGNGDDERGSKDKSRSSLFPRRHGNN